MAEALIEPMKQAVDNMILWISVKDKPFQCWYSHNPKLSCTIQNQTWIDLIIIKMMM